MKRWVVLALVVSHSSSVLACDAVPFDFIVKKSGAAPKGGATRGAGDTAISFAKSIIGDGSSQNVLSDAPLMDIRYTQVTNGRPYLSTIQWSYDPVDGQIASGITLTEVHGYFETMGLKLPLNAQTGAALNGVSVSNLTNYPGVSEQKKPGVDHAIASVAAMMTPPMSAEDLKNRITERNRETTTRRVPHFQRLSLLSSEKNRDTFGHGMLLACSVANFSRDVVSVVKKTPGSKTSEAYRKVSRHMTRNLLIDGVAAEAFKASKKSGKSATEIPVSIAGLSCKAVKTAAFELNEVRPRCGASPVKMKQDQPVVRGVREENTSALILSQSAVPEDRLVQIGSDLFEVICSHGGKSVNLTTGLSESNSEVDTLLPGILDSKHWARGKEILSGEKATLESMMDLASTDGAGLKSLSNRCDAEIGSSLPTSRVKGPSKGAPGVPTNRSEDVG